MKRKLIYLPIAALIMLIVIVFSPASFAVDGVLEINQVCAVNGGCFSGDEAGYPIVIDGSAGGSYRLTANLIVPDENTDDTCP